MRVQVSVAKYSAEKKGEQDNAATHTEDSFVPECCIEKMWHQQARM